MSEQFTMPLSNLPHWQASKLNIVQTQIHTPVPADDVYIVIQSDIDLRRRVEILEGLRNLSDALRDNNQVGSTGAVYAIVDIAGRKADIRFAADIATVTTTDLVVGIGPNMNLAHVVYSQIIESAFRMLREYANDEFFKKL